MSKTYPIVFSLLLGIFIATLALSTYGLGREEKDKTTAAYQAASAFTMISASGTIISLILLIGSILMMSTNTTSTGLLNLNKTV